MNKKRDGANNPDVKVGLDVTQAVKSRGRGIARYIQQVLTAMPSDGVESTLFIRGHRWFQRKLLSDLAPQAGRKWLLSGSRLNSQEIDLFHSFGNHLPTQSNVPLSFTLHDIRALDQPAGYEGKERLQRNILAADGIICLTHYGRDRLIHHYPDLNRDLIAVIGHGVDHQTFRPEAIEHAPVLQKKYGIEGDYIVQLGSWFPHKNLELSIEAFSRSQSFAQGHELIMIGGGATSAYRASIDSIVERTAVGDKLRWIEDVQSKDLPPLLAGARCLLQPSRYEGFALPVLEAMACGLPGVVSNASCLPEVTAGIWPLAAVDDPAKFAEGLDLMALDTPERQDTIEAGLNHSQKFSWERSAQLHDRFYRRVISASRA